MWLVLAVSLLGSRVCTAGVTKLEDKYNVTNENRNVDTNITLENDYFIIPALIPADSLNTLPVKKGLYNESHSEEITTTETDTRRDYPNFTFAITERTKEGTNLIKTRNDTQKETKSNVSLADENNSYQNISTQKIVNNIKFKIMKKLRQKQTKKTRKSSKKIRKWHNRENKQKLKDLKNYLIKEINISLQNNDTFESVENNKTDDTYSNLDELKNNTSTEITQFNTIENGDNRTNLEPWKARELYQITEDSMYNTTDKFMESLAKEIRISNKTGEINNGTNELRKIYKRNELNEYKTANEEKNINKTEVIIDNINKFEGNNINKEVNESKKNTETVDYINIAQDISKMNESQQIDKNDKDQEYNSPAEKRNIHIEEIIFGKVNNTGENLISDNNNRTNKFMIIDKIGELRQKNSINEVKNDRNGKKIKKMKKHLKYSIDIDTSKIIKNTSMTDKFNYSKITNNSFDNITDAIALLNLTDKWKENNENKSKANNLKKDGFLANNVNQSSTPKPVRQVIDYNNMMVDLISRYNAKASTFKLAPGSLEEIITHRHESTFTNSKVPNEMSSEIVYVEPGKYMRNTMYIQKLMKSFLSKWPQDFENKLPNRMSRHMYGDELSDTDFEEPNDALEVRIKKLRSQMFEILLTIEQIKRSLEERDTRNQRRMETDKKINRSLKLKQFDKLWRQLYSNYLNETDIATDSDLHDVMQHFEDDNGSFVNMFKKIFYFLTKRRFHRNERNQRDSPFNSMSKSNLNSYEFLKANPYYEIRNLKNLLKTFNIVHKKFIQNIIDSVENIERKNIVMIENEKKKSWPDDLALIVEKRCANMKKQELINDAGERMSRRRRNISNIEDTALRYILTLVDVLLNETPESDEVVDNAMVTTDDTKKQNNKELLTTKTQAQQESTTAARTEAEINVQLHREKDNHVTKPQGNNTITSSSVDTHTEANIDNYDMSEDKQYMYVSEGAPMMRDVEQVKEVMKDQLMEKETESYNSNYGRETTTFKTVGLTEKPRKDFDKSDKKTTTVKNGNHTEKDREPTNTNLSLETNTFQAIPSRKFYFYSNDYEQDISTVPELKTASTKKINSLKDEMKDPKKRKEEINDSDENTTEKASAYSYKDYVENNGDDFDKAKINKKPNQSKQMNILKKLIEEPKESRKQKDEFNISDEKFTRIANSSFKLFRDYIDLTDDEIDTTTTTVKNVTKSDSTSRKITTDSTTTEYTTKRKEETTRTKNKDAMKIEEEGVSGNSINHQYNNGYHFNSEGLLESVTDEPETHTITNKILMRKNTVLLDSLDYGLTSTDVKDTINKSKSSITTKKQHHNNKIDIRKKEVSSDDAEMAKTKLPNYFFDYQDNPGENTDTALNSVREANLDANVENKLNRKSAEDKNDSKQITTEFERGDDNDKGNYAIDREEGFQDPGEIEDSPAYF